MPRTSCSTITRWFNRESWRVFPLSNNPRCTMTRFSAWMMQTSSISGLQSPLRVPTLMSTKACRLTSKRKELTWPIPWWTKSPAWTQCLTSLWSTSSQLYSTPKFGINLKRSVISKWTRFNGVKLLSLATPLSLYKVFPALFPSEYQPSTMSSAPILSTASMFSTTGALLMMFYPTTPPSKFSTLWPMISKLCWIPTTCALFTSCTEKVCTRVLKLDSFSPKNKQTGWQATLTRWSTSSYHKMVPMKTQPWAFLSREPWTLLQLFYKQLSTSK